LPQEFQLTDQQIVITSGEGGIFPYGIIIGEIRKVNNNYNLTSRGLSSDLEFVQLIKKQND
jgi:cell shape-determining protein MreC